MQPLMRPGARRQAFCHPFADPLSGGGGGSLTGSPDGVIRRWMNELLVGFAISTEEQDLTA